MIDLLSFTIKDRPVQRLGTEDAPAVQDLLERCQDFNRMVSGEDTGPSDGLALLEDCPPQTDPADKFVFGLEGEDGRLLGLVDLIFDYPKPGICWIGLQLLDPAVRGQGIGRAFYTAVEGWAARRGAQHVRLGVVEQNRAGYGFWQALGFAEVERRLPVRFGMLDCVVIVMEKIIQKDRREP